MNDSPPPVPLLGDISLTAVQKIEHQVDGGFVPTRVVGLDGDVQQRSGRPSHTVQITGVLFGDSAAADLATLQKAGQTGDELTFSSDITKALDLQKVVISSFRALEVAGVPSRFEYDIVVTESPPLPPPAQLDSFGGLGDFGLGDLGFDPDGLSGVLGDLQSAAGDIASAVDAANQVVGTLNTIANLASAAGALNPGNFMAPISNVADKVSGIASGFKAAASGLSKAFSS
jgi:hypothetical protein